MPLVEYFPSHAKEHVQSWVGIGCPFHGVAGMSLQGLISGAFAATARKRRNGKRAIVDGTSLTLPLCVCMRDLSVWVGYNFGNLFVTDWTMHQMGMNSPALYEIIASPAYNWTKHYALPPR